MKKCSGCKLSKPVSDFWRDRSRYDGLTTYCKDCQTKKRNDRQDKIIQYLFNHPCADCPERDVIVLQFDHLGKKANNISSMVMNGVSWDKILREIKKCEVVCANCHIKRTSKRRNTHRYKQGKLRERQIGSFAKGCVRKDK